MNIVTRKLIAKELYVNRWFVAGGAASGVISILLAATGKMGFNVGALTWLTAIIATGVMLGIYGVMNERKEHALQFVLSLPLSIADYVRAKMLGVSACFLVMWLVSSGAALLLVFWKESIPDGIAPYTVLLCVFMLANFMVVLCGSIHAQSEALTSAVIVVTNMNITLFIFLILGHPALRDHLHAPAPVWNSIFWTVLSVEIATLVVTLSLPYIVAARRRDFI